MYKVFTLILFFTIGTSSYSQKDTLNSYYETLDLKFEQLKKELSNDIEQLKYSSELSNSRLEKKIKDYIKIQEEIISQFETKLSFSRSKIDENLKIIKSLGNNIDSILNESKKLTEGINLISKELSLAKKDIIKTSEETNLKMISLDDKVSSKALLSFLLVGFSIFIAIILFILLRKKLTDNKTKLDDQLDNTRRSIHEEHMKLDQKLIEMFESQLKLQNKEGNTDIKSNENEDHTLALKVADEIIRMQKNIVNMPEDTKGLKQLSRAIQRIQDSFKINGYEIVEMMGKTYNEGVKAAATIIPDENLKKGEQIITRIIKPQVNYNGKMIQSAEIEVSIGE